jgi:hypothetical protein
MVEHNIRNQKILGIITPSEWNPKGDIIGISLQGTNEIEYIVHLGKRGRELFNHIYEKIEIEGKIGERFDGKKTISVANFWIDSL